MPKYSQIAIFLGPPSQNPDFDTRLSGDGCKRFASSLDAVAISFFRKCVGGVVQFLYEQGLFALRHGHGQKSQSLLPLNIHDRIN